MREFKDKNGNRWPIDLTIGAAIRVRQQSDGAFDLFDPSKDDLGQRLADSLPAFWEVLWLVVEPQARAKSIDAEQFGELMAADCLIEAQKVFFGEWQEFFHQLQKPQNATVIRMLAAAQAKALELVKEKLASPILKNLDERIDQAMSAKLETSFGSLQESLDSILGPSPSASSGG